MSHLFIYCMMHASMGKWTLTDGTSLKCSLCLLCGAFLYSAESKITEQHGMSFAWYSNPSKLSDKHAFSAKDIGLFEYIDILLFVLSLDIHDFPLAYMVGYFLVIQILHVMPGNFSTIELIGCNTTTYTIGLVISHIMIFI